MRNGSITFASNDVGDSTLEQLAGKHGSEFEDDWLFDDIKGQPEDIFVFLKALARLPTWSALMFEQVSDAPCPALGELPESLRELAGSGYAGAAFGLWIFPDRSHPANAEEAIRCLCRAAYGEHPSAQERLGKHLMATP